MSCKLFVKESESRGDPQVNLTPLIDVVFVILIMFIVIAPLLEVDRISLADGGSPKNKSALNASPLTLHVRGDNTIWYQNQKVTLPQIPHLLKQAKASHPEARPQLFFDKNAPFGTYQSIKNSLEQVGFEELDIVLNPA